MARWGRLGTSGNVQDRRGMGGRAAVGGGVGVVGVVIYLLVSVLSGGGAGVEDVLNQLQPAQDPSGTQSAEFRGEDSYEEFASAVLGSNDETWGAIFTESGKQYAEPTLVLFRESTQSGCGGANSQVGPHYCPLDNTIYLDETFFDELVNRFGAEGGDVAEAYVIAHEVGHHVQNQLGVMEQVQSQQQANPDQANDLSVMVELQADCFAGVWANSIRNEGVFGPNEINEAMDAAAAVGDDRIQERVQGQVNPEQWTHGSSEARVQWFTTGFDGGDPAQCNTFG